MQFSLAKKSKIFTKFSTTISRFAKEKKVEEKKEEKTAPPTKGGAPGPAGESPESRTDDGDIREKDVTYAQYISMTKKLIPFANHQPGTKGFGLEGHVMKGFAAFVGEKDPVIGPSSSYPSWIHHTLAPRPSEEELQVKKQIQGRLEDREEKRLVKLIRKRKIKMANMGNF